MFRVTDEINLEQLESLTIYDEEVNNKNIVLLVNVSIITVIIVSLFFY